MENVGRPGGKPELQFSYWGLAQSLTTTTALMALSLVAMRAIERYGKKTFTPLQKQGLGLLATTVYFTAPTYAFPLRKPAPPSKPTSKKDDSSPPSLSGRARKLVPTKSKREAGGAQELTGRESGQTTCVPNEELSVTPLPIVPQDCPRIDPKIALGLIDELRTRVIQNGVRSITGQIIWNGRPLVIHVDISSGRKRQKVLDWIEDISHRLSPALPYDDSRDRVVEVADSSLVPLSASTIIRREEEDIVIVDVPSSPDPTMKVSPAPYVAEIHGPNGSLMRERLFKTLLNEYRRLLVEEMGLDPKQKRQRIAAMWHKTEAQQKLLDVLSYLSFMALRLPLGGIIQDIRGMRVATFS